MIQADSSMHSAVGRVRPGSSLSAIEQSLQAAYANVAKTLSPRDAAFIPFVDRGLSPSYATNPAALRLYWLLMSAVSLLLVLSCANAANLLLAKARRREQETAVRLAIGAGRGRIIRQLLVESLGIATLSGGFGLVIAKALTTTLQGMRLLYYHQDLGAVEIDGRVLGFCLLVTIGTLLIFGLVPALAASRADIRSVLGRSGRQMSSPHRLRGGLVIVQIAVSLTLVIGAGVFNRSLQKLFAADFGMNLNDVIELRLKPDDLGYSSARSAQVLSDTMDGLRRAGFRDVALTYPKPLDGASAAIEVMTDDMTQSERRIFEMRSVSPEAFEALRIPFLSGRGFTPAEYHEAESISPMPVVLNASSAKNLFGGRPALGRTFVLDATSAWPRSARWPSS